MDLSFTPEEHAFAQEVREWLAVHVEVPPRFETIADEVEFGRRWQAELAGGRWVGIHWPAEYGGRNASPVEVAIFNMEYARSRALQPINRVGINLAGPTLLAHGTDDQKQRWLPAILTAEEIWCQLFSEPDTGSDLASLQTRAVRIDDGWLLSGQKVWTSYAQFARWGICLARTDADAPKHKGISYLVVDMTAAGIEVRPLVQITGDAEFNEVFFDEVFVPDDHLVGALHNGWAVANTTLAHERGTAFPFKEQVVHEVYLDELWQLAHERSLLDDVEIADTLAQSFVELRVLRLHNWRTLSRLSRGIEPGPESSITKLAWTDMTQALSARALDVIGAAAPLWWGATDNPGGGFWQRQWLWSKAASIAGGTSEVQRTIIGDRILGLPRYVPRMKVVGFDHVVVNSTDIERSIAWYCDVLGCAPVRVEEWRRGEVLFPSVRVNAATIIDLFPAERTGENVNHFCLVIEPADLDALAQEFPGSNRGDGLFGAQGYASSLYVHDPDRNTIELRYYE